MLRSETTRRRLAIAWALCAIVGALAAVLVAAGNPGNMGLCGACFLRDTAGALGLFASPPKVFRPELAGVVFGALLLAVVRRRFGARSGSFAVSRLVLGVWMGIGALVFLGCPFRMLQRIGGGDLNAWIGALGFVLGVAVAVRLEQRGYSIGKTAPAPIPVGLWGAFTLLVLLVAFLRGRLLGPGPGDATGPAHAPWALALLIALPAGALLSATGFCAVSAARQVFQRQRRMLVGAGALIAGYAVVTAATGRFHLGVASQPAAHDDALWNVLSLALVGMTGAFAGGCPVRQLVMAGEGNGDAFVTVLGIALGGAIAHGLGLASTATGATEGGRIAVVAGLLVVIAYGMATTAALRRAGQAAAP